MNTQGSPSALLVTTDRFVFPARLAMALAAAGFSVEAVCPKGHFLSAVTAVKQLHPYGIFNGLSCVETAILESNPTLVIPCDDLARDHLHRLHASGRVRAAIERSLGDPTCYPVLESRSRLLTLLRRETDAAMETSVISSATELEDWLSKNGLPAVLKTDGSSGGYGVRVVRNAEEAEAARKKLEAPPGFLRALKRALFNRNTTFLLPAWKGVSPPVNVQKFVSGTEITSTLACWRGEVVAALTFEVLRVMYPGGPASVVRPVENPAIETLTRKIAARLGLSGLCGFDFIMDDAGKPHLIELNPRATQTAHLQLGAAYDTARALFAAVTGTTTATERADKITDITIALFPQEWMRDAESEFLKTGRHDVPWETPSLVEAIAKNLGKQASDIPLYK